MIKNRVMHSDLFLGTEHDGKAISMAYIFQTPPLPKPEDGLFPALDLPIFHLSGLVILVPKQMAQK